MGFNAIYAGSFDPITLGHLDIIKRSLYLCDHLTIGVGINSGKNPLFSLEERIAMINSSLYLHPISSHVHVEPFDGLLVDFAKKKGASVLIRGVRSNSDFEYENTIATINKDLARSIETIFLTASGPLTMVSSSVVKEIARFDGHIYNYVPTHVGDAVYKKIKQNKAIESILTKEST
jgi:pantetheine-phosphate adenylyltransferase